MVTQTALLLARAQFAFTVSFHFIFPAFSIGLASFLALHAFGGLAGLRLVFGHGALVRLRELRDRRLVLLLGALHRLLVGVIHARDLEVHLAGVHARAHAAGALGGDGAHRPRPARGAHAAARARFPETPSR